MSVTPPVLYGDGNALNPGSYDIPIEYGGRRRRFEGFFTITPERLAQENFNGTDYYDSSHYWKCRFPYLNGNLEVRMWVEDITYPGDPPQVLNNHVHIQILAAYKGSGGTDVYTELIGDGNVIVNQSFHANTGYITQYGVKICFTTYYDGVTEVTEASNIKLECYVPGASAALDNSIVTFMNVVPGARLYSINVIGTQDFREYFCSDQGLGYGLSPTSVWTTLPLMHIGYCNISDLEAFAQLFNAHKEDLDIGVPAPNPPSGEDDDSGPGGGGGDYDPSSDPIDFPGLPTGGAFASGAIKAYKVTDGTLQNIFARLWNASLFDLDTFQKLVQEPLEAIITLVAVPVAITGANTEHIKLGGYDTEQSGTRVPSQYITVDCGSLVVNEFWGSALDYTLTKIEIYLPFIGIRQLQADDVMQHTIRVKYNIDILTGDLVAQIKCGQSVLYKFNGNLRTTIPVTSRVYDAMAKAIAGYAATGVAALTGNAPAALAAHAATGLSMIMSKPQISRAGDISGVSGVLDDFVPYLIIHRPKQSLAQNFRNEKGYRSNITAVLGSLTGYTEVEYIHLTGIDGATDTELNEIEDLLKNGVII